MNKKSRLFQISLIFLLFLFLSIPNTFAWTITEDRVWQNDSNCYISVEPHTLGSSGWSVVTFKSHSYTGNVDVCYGFDTNVAVPRSPSWKNHWENTTTNHQSYFHNVTDIILYNGSNFDYGNEYNSYQRTVTYHRPIDWNESSNVTTYELNTVNVSFDSYEQDETNYTIYWHTNHSKWMNWTPIPNSRYHSTTYDFQGFDKWYYATDLSVTAGVEYQIRIWLDVPVSLEGSSGKYFFGIKPSSETLNQAISNGHFYYLDPWWDSTYDWRKLLTVDHINASGSTLVNFPAYINVSKETEMQSDYDDVVFVDNSGNTMDYELENYTSEYGIYWVNITSLSITGTSFWMYYGNDEATSQENPNGVWNSNYVMVHHMNDLNDSTSYQEVATNYGAVYNYSWLLNGNYQYNGVNNYWNLGNHPQYNITDTMMLETWVKIGTWDLWHTVWSKNVDADNQISLALWNDNTLHGYIRKDGSSSCSVATDVITLGEWNHIVFTIDETAQIAKIYQNGVFKNQDTSFTLADTSTANFEIMKRGDNDYYLDGSIDEIRISSVARSADWNNESYQLVVNQSTFVTWGSTEQLPLEPKWFQYVTSIGWINYSWFYDTGIDSFNISFNEVWDNGSTNTSLNCNVGAGNWANITIYGYNFTYDLLSSTSVGANIESPSVGGSNWYTLGQNYNHTALSLSSNSPKYGVPIWKANVTGDLDEFTGAVVVDGVVYISGKKYDTAHSGWEYTFALYANNGSEIWRFNTGSVDDSPTYYNENLYVQTDTHTNTEYLWCLDATTGNPVWNFSVSVGTDDTYTGTPAIGIEESLVFTSVNTKVYGININNGTESWNTTITQCSGMASSLTYYNKTLYVVSYSTNQNNNFLHAINATTGVILWSSNNSGASGWGSWDSSPTIYNNTLFVGIYGHGADDLVAYELNGTKKWGINLGVGGVSTAYILTTPAIHNGVIFCGGYAGSSQYKLHAVYENGTKKWNYSVGGKIFSSPAISNGIVYFGSLDKYIYALNESDGTLIWKYLTDGKVYGQAVVANDTLFIASDDWYLYAFKDLILLPINLQPSVGLDYVNWAWDANDFGLQADSFNITVNNGVSWFNASNNYFVHNCGDGSWSNIMIYSYNATYDKLSSPASGSSYVKKASTKSYTSVGNRIYKNESELTAIRDLIYKSISIDKSMNIIKINFDPNKKSYIKRYNIEESLYFSSDDPSTEFLTTDDYLYIKITPTKIGDPFYHYSIPVTASTDGTRESRTIDFYLIDTMCYIESSSLIESKHASKLNYIFTANQNQIVGIRIWWIIISIIILFAYLIKNPPEFTMNQRRRR